MLRFRPRRATTVPAASRALAELQYLVVLLVFVALGSLVDAGPLRAGETPPAAASDWRAARLAAADAYRAKLATLADRCDRLELAEQARIVRAWFVPRDPARRYVFPPRTTDPAAPDRDAPQVVGQWYAKFRELRAEQAEALIVVARQALEAGEPSRAYALLHEALRENPDHPIVRRALQLPPPEKEGDRPAEGTGKATGNSGRAKPHAGASSVIPRPKSTAPTTDHPRTGWKRGKYWRAESEHFRVSTNQSADAAAAAAQTLEEVHAAWRQICFSFWSRGEALAARLAGRDDPLGPVRKHDVVVFRSRAEYVAALQASQPRIEATVGIYLDEQRAAYLYVGDDSAPAWAHEVAHQLFQESHQTPPGVGKESNLWAAEAAAIYFESFRGGADYFLVGGQDADRLQFARYAMLRGDVALPLDQLAALGRDALQARPDISKLYRQSSAVGHWLYDGEDGRHAEAWLDFLRQLYAGRGGADALFQRLAIGSAEVEKRVLAGLVLTDADLARWPSIAASRHLSFSRAKLTDDGLRRLSGLDSLATLEWLDLSLTDAGDEGVKAFQSAKKLRQLFAEHSRVTDAGLATLASFPELEELDLARTKITDAGLVQIARLKRLKTLYLTGCDVGDEGLAVLKALKQLETLDVAETRATESGLAALRRALPKLKP